MEIGYLFLIIALLCGAIKGACGKKTSGFVERYSDAMFVNFVRMTFCALIGFFIIFASGDTSALNIDIKTAGICILSSLATCGFVVFWLICIKNGAYVLMDVFLTLFVIVPMIGGRALYHEEIRINQWIGFFMLIVAAYQMCRFSSGLNKKMTVKNFLLFVACGLSNGMADFSQKIYVKSVQNVNIAVFNFYTYLFSAIILIVLFFILREKHTKPKNTSNIIGYIGIMAACLFLNSFFKTRAATILTSAQLYPVAQGGALVLSVLVSWLLFKEKPDKKCISGVFIAFLAILIMGMF